METRLVDLTTLLLDRLRNIWQLPYLNQRYGENGCRNDFIMLNLHEIMFNRTDKGRTHDYLNTRRTCILPSYQAWQDFNGITYLWDFLWWDDVSLSSHSSPSTGGFEKYLCNIYWTAPAVLHSISVVDTAQISFDDAQPLKTIVHRFQHCQMHNFSSISALDSSEALNVTVQFVLWRSRRKTNSL